MSERGIHYIDADLDESWLRDWIGVGLVELEAYLEKQAAFLDFLRVRDPQPSQRAVGPALGTAAP